MMTVQNKNSSYFVEWIPNNVKSSVCSRSRPSFNVLICYAMSEGDCLWHIQKLC